MQTAIGWVRCSMWMHKWCFWCLHSMWKCFHWRASFYSTSANCSATKKDAHTAHLLSAYVILKHWPKTGKLIFLLHFCFMKATPKSWHTCNCGSHLSNHCPCFQFYGEKKIPSSTPIQNSLHGPSSTAFEPSEIFVINLQDIRSKSLTGLYCFIKRERES